MRLRLRTIPVRAHAGRLARLTPDESQQHRAIVIALAVGIVAILAGCYTL